MPLIRILLGLAVFLQALFMWQQGTDPELALPLAVLGFLYLAWAIFRARQSKKSAADTPTQDRSA